MQIKKLLKQLLVDKKLNQQQYRTYLGQVMSGDDFACVVGLERNHLISSELADKMKKGIMLAYTE